MLLILTAMPVLSAEMLDADYQFIDTAFDGIKPVTNKQFNDTINALTPQPVENTFGAKLKAFLFGRKYGVETPPQIENKDLDNGGELKAIQDIKNGIHYIRLSTAVVGLEGKIIPLGDYKIQEKHINNENVLVFYQGREEYGMLKLKQFEDNLKKENDITYARVDVINDNLIRIVYSTLSDTKCAYAKVYNLQN